VSFCGRGKTLTEIRPRCGLYDSACRAGIIRASRPGAEAIAEANLRSVPWNSFPTAKHAWRHDCLEDYQQPQAQDESKRRGLCGRTALPEDFERQPASFSPPGSPKPLPGEAMDAGPESQASSAALAATVTAKCLIVSKMPGAFWPLSPRSVSSFGGRCRCGPRVVIGGAPQNWPEPVLSTNPFKGVSCVLKISKSI